MTQYVQEHDLFKRGMTALVDALGWDDALHFLRLDDREKGENYTEERRSWQESLDVETYLDDVFTLQAEFQNKQLVQP